MDKIEANLLKKLESKIESRMLQKIEDKKNETKDVQIASVDKNTTSSSSQ